MDEKQIQLIILKRDLQSAINAIDSLISPEATPVRRGRPPKTIAMAKASTKTGRSEESRKQQSERMRAYWESRKKAAKKASKD